MSEKKASVDWTIGRLLTFVLLIIVLVLVIYGISTKGLNPLFERLGGMFDSVLILLHVKDDGFENDNCYVEKVSVLSDGDILLGNLYLNEAEKEKIELNVCRDSVCAIKGSEELGEYRFNKGVFEKKKGEEWGVYLFSIRDINVFKEDLEKLSLEEFKIKYDVDRTRQFVLTRSNILAIAVWSSGTWVVKDKDKIVYSGSSDDEALESFKELVNGPKIFGSWFSSFVYYGILDANDRDYFKVASVETGISNLVGDDRGNDFLDTEEDMINLKSEFSKIKESLLDEINFDKEDFQEIYNAHLIKNFIISKCG